MAIELRQVDTKEIRPFKPATAAVVKKFEALGVVQFPEASLVAVADGWVGMVGEAGARRPAVLLRKDKVARFVEACPASFYQQPIARDDGQAALFASAATANDARVFELSVADETTRVVWQGENLSFRYGPAGHVIARKGDTLLVVRMEDAKVVAAKELPHAADYAFLQIGCVAGGRVILAHSIAPHEIVALGFYAGEADLLRHVGAVPYRWGGAFLEQEGRPFVSTGGRSPKVSEVLHLAEAWEAGRAGEMAQKEPAPGALGFKPVRFGTYEAGSPVANLRELSGERDPIVPCKDGGWVTAVRLSRKQVRVVVVDKALAVRSVDLPPAEYPALRVNEAGTSALAGDLEIDLASLAVRALGTGSREVVDFGPAGRFVVGGTRVCERGREGTLREVACLDLFVDQFVTAADGRVVAATSVLEDGTRALALLGVYDTPRGAELRLIATPDRPPGVSLYFRRVGAHVMALADDYLELFGAAETWERQKNAPALPLDGLRKRQPPPAPVAVRPVATPRLDALILEITRRPRRANLPAVHARVLAGALPPEVRRLVQALADHEHGYLSAGDLEIDEATLSDSVPGRTGARSDLVRIGKDGGGNLFAIDKEAGEDGSMLFLDHEDGFADRSLGLSLEELVGRDAQRSSDGDGDDGNVEGGSAPAAAEPSGAARRLTCVEGGASKFWEGSVEGTTLTVRFGKIGTAGQTKTKSFASADAARRELEKTIEEKLGKGYQG